MVCFCWSLYWVVYTWYYGLSKLSLICLEIIMEKRNYKYVARVPQSVVSDTLPNQTVDLSILVKQLMDGQALNVGLSLSEDTSDTLDTPDITKYDFRHMTVSDVDNLLSKVQPVQVDVPAETGTAPVAD